LLLQFDVIAIMQGHIFHPLASSIRERKSLNYEGSAYLQKTCYNCIKAKNYPHLAFARLKSNWKVCEGLASTVYFVVTTKNTENQWSHGFRTYDKTKNLSRWSRTDMCKLRWLCSDL